MKINKDYAPTREPVAAVNADPKMGLTGEQADLRKACGWANIAPTSASKTEQQIILSHTLTFFNLVFVVLAVILVFVQSSPKNMTFLIVAAINTVIGIVQEIRAKRAVDKLTLVAAQTVRTVREGKIVEIRSDLLVRDDIVIFKAGDQICADGILRTGELQVNESLITGEADAITKRPGDPLKSGSFVIAGKGRVQLTAVGVDAFAAKLSLEAKADPKAAKSEMMLSLDRMIHFIGFALIPIGALLFWQEFVRLGLDLRTSGESTVAALVGMIPEGLYLLTSIALAASALKLTRQRVLVQDMNCIETLARVDVLCVDKTGTITEAKMEVENILPLSDQPPERLEQILTGLYGDGEPENDTARALSELFPGKCDWELLRRIPFTSAAKWSGGVFRDQGAYLVGAPEFILGSRFEEVREMTEPWSAKGYRVLLVAQYHGEPEPGNLDEGAISPLALLLLTNRVRPEAPDTFRYFAQQGVAIKVISGDNPATVSSVAKRAGIENAENYVDANLLETEDDFLKAVDQFTVFGRVTPDKKRNLIRALKAKGHTVAMTGDGVNDVLAMKESDCGIAMASGAQAASQVARLVLLDNDFSTMPSIVGEGRRVINNIQRAAALFLVKNIFSLGLSLLSLLTGWAYPMVPFHLSVISALTIGVPSFFLAMEPNYERVTGKFLPSVLRRALPGGVTNIFVVLMAQAFMVIFGIPQEQISAVCASILGVVGMLVLYQVCKPFDKFRKVIWWLMAAGLVISFTALGGLFDLSVNTPQSCLVMATLLIMTPTVFSAMGRLFDWTDKLTAWIQAGGLDQLKARLGRLRLPGGKAQ
ncbi:MAG: HAD-IC family P-type ATPase [Oscillospiraceae bacterium]|nr:HAD-IC family P-type ATPase [Oscillospiraceae bacterium]